MVIKDGDVLMCEDCVMSKEGFFNASEIDIWSNSSFLPVELRGNRQVFVAKAAEWTFRPQRIQICQRMKQERGGKDVKGTWLKGHHSQICACCWFLCTAKKTVTAGVVHGIWCIKWCPLRQWEMISPIHIPPFWRSVKVRCLKPQARHSSPSKVPMYAMLYWSWNEVSQWQTRHNQNSMQSKSTEFDSIQFDSAQFD